MKTGCTSTMKNIIFSLCSVCTVFVPFKMENFQLLLTVNDLHNYKGVPYANGLGFLENDIGVAEMSGMLFSKIKIIEPLTIETFRPSYLSMVV